MSSIEDAIEQLETSASKLKKLSVEESRAIREAVKDATKEATDKVKAEYKEKKAQARKEAKEAEKAIKDAQSRIQKALGSEKSTSSSGKRAKRGEREAQFVDYVKANPDSKLADIARGIGVQNSAANGLAKKAVAAGKVKKSAEKTYTVA
ncbi:MAG: hypothetical protein KDB54_02485 [Solirubrobacterales bacterium]|nr:hypothetical protein [Solirubrobacterales bacterium]MCB0859497.1 hypothetical protein [Solirubrobacterales bacterium]